MKTLVLCSAMILIAGCASHHESFTPSAPTPANNTVVEQAPQTPSAPITEADDAELKYQASILRIQEEMANEESQLAVCLQVQGKTAYLAMKKEVCAVTSAIDTRGIEWPKNYCK